MHKFTVKFQNFFGPCTGAMHNALCRSTQTPNSGTAGCTSLRWSVPFWWKFFLPHWRTVPDFTTF